MYIYVYIYNWLGNWLTMLTWIFVGQVVVSNNFQTFFIFAPKIGQDSHFDDHIFQMGGNHQLAKSWAMS